MWITYLLLILIAVSVTSLVLWISLKPTRNAQTHSKPLPLDTSTIPKVPSANPIPATTPATTHANPPAAPHNPDIGEITGGSSGGPVLSPGSFSSPNASSTPIGNSSRMRSAELGPPIPFNLNPTAAPTSGV
jgi:hypothetical protein